ncbi:hypothetical protein LCGC14_2801500, partial [marine sediment metagenome]
MANARTAQTLPSQATSITLTPNEPTGEGFLSASVNMHLHSAGVTSQGGFQSDPHNDDNPEPEEGNKWIGVYIHYKVDFSETIDDADVFLWRYDEEVDEDEETDDFPTVYDVVESFSLTITITLTGVFRTTVVTEEPPPTREFTGQEDRRMTDWWATDAASSWTISADWGAGSGSDSGNYGPGINEFADILTSVVLKCYPNNCGTDQDIVTISGWTSGVVTVDLSLALLYNPGLDFPDSALNPSWGRTATGAASYLYFDSGTLKVVGSLPGVTGQTTLSLGSWLPVDVTFTPRTGKFGEDVEYNPKIIGNPIEWTESFPGAGDWTSAPVPFFGPHRVQEHRRSWVFDFEWQFLETRNIVLNIDGTWATQAGEITENCLLLPPPINAA